MVLAKCLPWHEQHCLTTNGRAMRRHRADYPCLVSPYGSLATTRGKRGPRASDLIGLRASSVRVNNLQTLAAAAHGARSTEVSVPIMWYILDLDPTGSHSKMEGKPAGKSQRKRLQRQLEFYLSESNLRQDKFLQQAMDEQGFVPARVFLSFNKLKTLKATERMILDEAEKSSAIRVDRARSSIAPKVVPAAGQDVDADARTVYIDSFGATDDHDSLRRTFAKFGKVNLVSLPRFSQNKKFKGFGFVEFSERSAADEAAAAAKTSNADLRGIRVMSKTRWLEMKEQLKHQLSCGDEPTNSASSRPDNATARKEPSSGDSVGTATTEKKKRKRGKAAASEHIHFSGDEEEGNNEEPSPSEPQEVKKQKV